MFIGDSEIVLKMIARYDPAGLPILYGTKIMEISTLSNTANWHWCPGALNPADLLTRSGSTLEKINSRFLLQGSFLSQPPSSWPNKSCVSLISDQIPSAMFKKVSATPPNSLIEYITELLTNNWSYSKILKSFCALLKIDRTYSGSPDNLLPWTKTRNAIASNIISCFKSSTESYIAKNKLKHLLVQPQDGIYYLSDRSFRSHIGVPLVCGKTILADCIVQDAHNKLGHGHDILQIFSTIQVEFYIPGVRKLILCLKKSCPGCVKLNKISFSEVKGELPDILKSVQPTFSYCQADLCGPIFAYNGDTPSKPWVLVILCLSSHAVHLEILHHYSALSISRGFRRTFALQGIPRVIWIDTGLNIVKSGKDLMQSEVKVVSKLNLKFSKIEFRAMLPKHHEGIGAVE